MCENTPTAISLYLGDIDISAFDSVIKEKYASELITFQEKEIKKEGKGLLEALEVLTSHSVSLNVLACVVYDLSKIAFSQLNLSFRIKPPSAVIKFKDGTKVELPSSLSDEELQKRLEEQLKYGPIESIRYK